MSEGGLCVENVPLCETCVFGNKIVCTENIICKKYGVLDYLGACFDVLHRTGRAYIVEDIDIFINARKGA
jgi:hypothetical protein